ncbi:phage baseplate protein [Nocardia sp. XZ_19_231]|uniref:T4 family baseplate hub assembly chaperone n=1 Tax=Nocardia sp. XZ_19_231 TaxID=2769252 RepID=UPI00188EE63A|nr:phage baseplate protein [Nocardia sp. XZ_19_231]
MTEPHIETLLAAWDYGCDRSLTHGALALLATVNPGASLNQLATLSIGDRDRQLMGLRAQLFGDLASCLAVCPTCQASLELSFGIGEVQPAPSADGGVLCTGGFEIAYRTPTSADLLDVAESPPPRARELLLARCVRDVRLEGEATRLDTIPTDVIDALVDALAQADPAARVEFALACPECANHWAEPFDIASFLWAEVDHWAQRQLREVHMLALAYGWRERDVMAMSARRRRRYLELIGT